MDYGPNLSAGGMQMSALFSVSAPVACPWGKAA